MNELDVTRAGRWFGTSVPRREDHALLTGQGRFVDDLDVPGVLHAFIVRSELAHARIVSIDTSAALQAPGVQLVWTHADLPEPARSKPLPLVVPNPAIRHPLTQLTLARDEVCYVGQPVAIIVAQSRAQAEDAATRIAIDYDPLPAVVSIETALIDTATTAHAGRDNLAGEVVFAHGDPAGALADAPHRLREVFRIHRAGAHFMECRGLVAIPDVAEQGVTVWIAAQSPHRAKRILAEMLALGDSDLRVVAPPDVGGGFGPKGSFYPEYVAVTACALALGRPVKWIEDRRENFVATHQERDQVWTMEVAFDDQGRLLALQGDMLHDCGAFIPWGLVLPWIAATTVQGGYVVPAQHLTLRAVFTNKVPTTPVRGAGRPQAVFVMERLMDRIADHLGRDRAAVRMANLIRADQMPYNCKVIGRDGRPVVYDSGDYPATQQRVLAMADWAGFPARQRAALQQGRYIGQGIGNFVEATGLGPYEGATVRVSTTGRIALYTGAAPQGQSHVTTLSQICADALGVTPHDIEVTTGDTKGIPLGVGTFAARSAVNAGNAVHLAALEVRRKALAIAGQLLGVSVDALQMTGGRVQVTDQPECGRSLRELAVYAVGMPGYSLPEGVSPGLEHTAYFTPEQSTYSNGAHVAEVEVDPETCQITLTGYWVVDDCGRVINPVVVMGQVLGGVVHGIGNALFEWMGYDENGQPITMNFGEYLLPLASDIPRIEVDHTETPSPLNPLGVKGAGEGGTLPAIAAIVAAIENALAPFNVHINEAPVAPQRLFELLRETASRAARDAAAERARLRR